MATYAQIQKYVQKEYGFVAQTCWIAHVKEIYGLQPRVSHNRYDPAKREKPCPQEKIEPTKEAFRHFGMIKNLSENCHICQNGDAGKINKG